MDINKDNTSIKFYTISLVTAILVLLTAVTFSYQHIKRLEQSSKLVNHSLMVEREIHKMFASYAIQKSSLFDYAITGNTDFLSRMDIYKLQGNSALERVRVLTFSDPKQQADIELMMLVRTDFSKQLDVLSNLRQNNSTPQVLNNQMAKISVLMEQLRALKDDMISNAVIDLDKNSRIYSASVKFTPITIWGVALVSIIVFCLAFLRILRKRREMEETKAFLVNILKTTDNLIDHYKPVRDEANEIVDFTVVFTNDQITDGTGLLPKSIIGKRLSELYPITFENGYFRTIKDCVDHDKIVQFEHHYTFLGKVKTFWTTAVKFGDAVTITSVDVSPLKSTTRQLEEISQELVAKSTALDSAEIIARGGSFHLDVKTGVAEFSENFHRVFGLSSTGISFFFSEFKSFVHPEDIEIFDNHINELLESKIESQQAYRIITVDGSVRNLMSTGRFIVENGRDSLVGVVQDITQEVQRKTYIEDQNVELKRSNEELASFSHVVSHDLQEPLRKIQLFISLISEDALLSEENRLYFKKIVRAAHRMQTLIIDLLSYSRIGHNDNDFEKVDLNEILDKVQENQNYRITRKVNITINQLPTVNAIPFQMEQLFNNLVSNAIKYRIPGQECKILITSEVVQRSEIQEHFRKRFPKYHRITVTDNGTGFNQDFADKIFEVFQRLHQKTEYSGTGIGLAICKKITENHNGYITAIGEINKGATFIIYLPGN